MMIIPRPPYSADANEAPRVGLAQSLADAAFGPCSASPRPARSFHRLPDNCRPRAFAAFEQRARPRARAALACAHAVETNSAPYIQSRLVSDCPALRLP